MYTTHTKSLLNDARAERDALISLRRHFHMHPEISGQARETQAFVCATLEAWGIAASPLGETGVVATLKGAEPGPCMLLRADMDALPIDETAPVPFRSRVPGVMHACGHDTHMAMLLVAAKMLRERGLPRGSVRCLFQPAEEGGGGAQMMIDAGVLRAPVPDAALALHVWSLFATGEVAIIDGPVMAAVDGFEIEITGRGTHGATPESGIDPIAIAAQLVTAAQQIVARRIAPHDAAVLTFGRIQGGSAFNIIPEQVRLLGTLRSFVPEVRAQLRDALADLVAHLPAAMGATGRIAYFTEHAATVNDPRIAAVVRDLAASLPGVTAIQPRPLMAGEDFGLILAQVPGAMILVGCGGSTPADAAPHHHPDFAVDEDCLPMGTALLVGTAERFLATR